MEKHLADALLKAAFNLYKDLGDMDAIISGIPDEATKKHYVTILGNLIGDVTANIISPLIQEYPELNPQCPSGDFASHMSRLPVAEISA